ncbi:MAG: LLM class flavin-dependent oxidoreductase [Acidimicrobiia bacterium]
MELRRAIGFTPSHTDLRILVDAAVLADELGYEVVVVPEGWCLDSTLVLGAMAAATRRINLAAAILSIWGRTPATLAMTAATLQEISSGRFILGLGASTPALVEGFHDVRFEQPAAKLRKVTRTVRTLLEGGRAPQTVETTQRALRLGASPPAPVPIWHGTVGPQARRVTAETADAWFPAWLSYRGAPRLITELAEARAASNPDAAPLMMVGGPIVEVNDDLDAARASTGATIAWYLCSMGNLHPQFIASQGYEAEVRLVQEANPRLTPATGVIPESAESLIDDFAVAGPADVVRTQLAQWDSVYDIVTIGMPPPGSPWEAFETTIRACAP